jgi:hypothetical protein
MPVGRLETGYTDGGSFYRGPESGGAPAAVGGDGLFGSGAFGRLLRKRLADREKLEAERLAQERMRTKAMSRESRAGELGSTDRLSDQVRMAEGRAAIAKANVVGGRSPKTLKTIGGATGYFEDPMTMSGAEREQFAPKNVQMAFGPEQVAGAETKAKGEEAWMQGMGRQRRRALAGGTGRFDEPEQMVTGEEFGPEGQVRRRSYGYA